MANTIFVLDLYGRGINTLLADRYSESLCAAVTICTIGVPSIDLSQTFVYAGKQLFNASIP
jgi:hypothetical protein